MKTKTIDYESLQTSIVFTVDNDSKIYYQEGQYGIYQNRLVRNSDAIHAISACQIDVTVYFFAGRYAMFRSA